MTSKIVFLLLCVSLQVLDVHTTPIDPKSSKEPLLNMRSGFSRGLLTIADSVARGFGYTLEKIESKAHAADLVEGASNRGGNKRFGYTKQRIDSNGLSKDILPGRVSIFKIRSLAWRQHLKAFSRLFPSVHLTITNLTPLPLLAESTVAAAPAPAPEPTLEATIEPLFYDLLLDASPEPSPYLQLEGDLFEVTVPKIPVEWLRGPLPGASPEQTRDSFTETIFGRPEEPSPEPSMEVKLENGPFTYVSVGSRPQEETPWSSISVFMRNVYNRARAAVLH